MIEQILQDLENRITKLENTDPLSDSSTITLAQDQAIRDRFKQVYLLTTNIDLGNQGAGTATTADVPFGDAGIGDAVFVSLPSAVIDLNVYFKCYIASQGLVRLTSDNNNGGNRNYGSQSYTFAVFKQ